MERILKVFAVYRQARSGTNIYEFDTELDPVEAAVMIDAVDEGEVKKVILYRLASLGYLEPVETGHGVFYVVRNGIGELTYYEKYLLVR